MVFDAGKGMAMGAAKNRNVQRAAVGAAALGAAYAVTRPGFKSMLDTNKKAYNLGIEDGVRLATQFFDEEKSIVTLNSYVAGVEKGMIRVQRATPTAVNVRKVRNALLVASVGALAYENRGRIKKAFKVLSE